MKIRIEPVRLATKSPHVRTGVQAGKTPKPVQPPPPPPAVIVVL